MKAILAVCLMVVLTTAVLGVPMKTKKLRHPSVGVPIGTCTEPGQYLADSFDCQAFYECDEDLIPQPYLCDPGLCWYEALQECVWDDQGTCTIPCSS